MQFQEVHVLVPGTKYRVICLSTFLFTGTFLEDGDDHYMFESVYHRATFMERHPFSHVMNRFYEPIFQRDRIQSAMEHRAVNLILQRITGDPTFTW